MSLSERERTVLDQLEREFDPSPAPQIASRWSSAGVASHALVAAVTLTAGLAVVLLGLILDNVAGVALAALAYVAMVGSATILVNYTSGARDSLARHARRNSTTTHET